MTLPDYSDYQDDDSYWEKAFSFESWRHDKAAKVEEMVTGMLSRGTSLDVFTKYAHSKIDESIPVRFEDFSKVAINCLVGTEELILWHDDMSWVCGIDTLYDVYSDRHELAILIAVLICHFASFEAYNRHLERGEEIPC